MMQVVLFKSTHSMTKQLAIFFTLMSLVVGGFCFVLITSLLLWSEDRVGERRLKIDRDEAISYFIANPQAHTYQLDKLTTAYNTVADVPEAYRGHLLGKEYFLDEADSFLAPEESRMLYLSHYYDQGQQQPIVLLSLLDHVEIKQQEYILVVGFVFSLVCILLFIFGSLLLRLSARLIAPLNRLQEQLDASQGDLEHQFMVSKDAAEEFQSLAKHLNTYRERINDTLKREQAFARYASHELRTPLTVIQGSTKLLLRHTQDPFEIRQAQRIAETSQQMTDVVDVLLSLVRYERDQSQVPLRQIERAELENIMATDQRQAQAKGLKLTLEFEAGAKVKATPAVLSLVLGNLLRNAIAASDQGQVIMRADAMGISIEDQGTGLIQSYDPKGHGLGLLIVDDLCQRYQWQFSLYNAELGGCVANIRF